MDLGIIGTIIAIVIVVIIVISLRALREKYVWMDSVVAFIMIGAVIAGWILSRHVYHSWFYHITCINTFAIQWILSEFNGLSY